MDFPQPEGPTMATVCPFLTWPERRWCGLGHYLKTQVCQDRHSLAGRVGEGETTDDYVVIHAHLGRKIMNYK